MFNSKNTKRSLLMSALALVLCVSMLVGSTFAWFTDMASTSVNAIQSGTLDIELLMKQGDGWVSAEGQTLNFIAKDGTQNILWEPGCTYELPALKVVNKGNLHVKYQIHITGIEGDAKLLEVIDFTIEGKDALTGTLAPNAETPAITLIGSMAKEAGNEYMGLTMEAISITVYATQMTAENDTYGPDYDEDAWHPAMKVYNANDLQAALNNGETNIVVMDNIDLTESLVIPAAASTFAMRSAPATVINLNGKTITGAIHKSVGHVVYNAGNLILRNGTIKSVADNGGSAIYNAVGATLVAEDLTVQGAPIAGDSWPSYAINNYGTATINNCVITSMHGTICSYGEAAMTTLNNVTATISPDGAATKRSSHVLYTYANGKMVVNSGTYTNNAGDATSTGGTVVCNNNSSADATIEINGGTFKGGCGLSEYDKGNIWVNGGTFQSNPKNYLAEGFQAVAGADGSLTVLPETGDVAIAPVAGFNGIYADKADNRAYYVFNKTGMMELNALLASVSHGEGVPVTVELMADVDLAGEDWEPINSMWVIFNGNGHTISNMTADMAADGRRSGFWGYAGAVTINDLTLENATVSGSQAGIFAAGGEGLKMNNCFVKGDNTVNFVPGVETWNGIGAICGVTVSSNINAEIVAGATVTLNRNNMVTDAGCVYIDDLTGHIQANSGVVTNNGTVIANGDCYTYVADGLGKNGNTYLVTNANGLEKMNAMFADRTAGKGVVINLGADIDFTGKTWTTVDSHVDGGCYLKEMNGNGYTVSNFNVNGQAMFRRFANGAGVDVVIKDITFDNATIASNGNINTSLFVVQTYNNLLLENVTMKNSSVTGGYKVGTLVGTVYDENPSATITLTVKDCVIDNCTVTTTAYDFATCGIIGWVNVGDADKVVFENTAISNVTLANTKSSGYALHAFVYYDGENCVNEAEGVTVTNCTFVSK